MTVETVADAPAAGSAAVSAVSGDVCDDRLSWSESGELLAARDPELVTRLQQTATRGRFEAMRGLRSQIDGLGINEARSLLEALPSRPPSAAAG